MHMKGAACAAALLMLMAVARPASAQDFTAGAALGYGFAKGLTGTLPNGTTADAGPRNSAALGFWLRDDMYANLSGEFRYLYRFGSHQVENGTGEAKLGAHSHLFHYDLLFHTAPAASPLRPYLAVGAGGRIYQGTGTPPRVQALSNLVLLRKATETRPMLSLGGGVRLNWGRNRVLQFDLRDYATPAPRKVFAPSSTSTVSGWIHDIVPQVSIGVKF